MTATAADIQAAFCATLCDEWARHGVTDAVVSPGSRSTPMVAALHAEERIRLTVVLDERSAGFHALGMGLATGRPALVVTTSGTASVELHPAVVEAAQAGIPLVAVTTDRPPELHRVGAPQTVEQHGLFGDAPRWSFDPGVADAATAGTWRSLAARCVAEAVAHPSGPGPVHLNLPFREPLLGDPAAFGRPEGRADGAPWHGPVATSRLAGGGVTREVAELLGRHAGGRGLIVAGAGAGPAALDLARRLGWPLLADPRSGCRVPDAYVVSSADLLLRHPGLAAAGRPEFVLRVGRPWASKVLNQWLASLPGDVPQMLCDPTRSWDDPDRAASHTVAATAADLLATLGGAQGGPPTPSAWLEAWAAAESAALAAVGSLADPGAELDLSEPAVARAVVAGAPDGGLVFVSSSMPVRDVEWFSAPRPHLTVASNRGANGIDGVLSTALGAALASGMPTVAFTGDLAFLYDAGALLGATAGAAAGGARIRIVVVDNDGGGIFSFLPQAAALEPELFERYWGTPQGVDVVALASAYGVAAERLGDRAGLDAFVSGVGDAPPGISVGVVGSERAANVEDHQRFNRAVADAVDPLVGSFAGG